MSRVTIKDKTFETSIPEAEILERVKLVADRINKDFEGKTPLFLAVLNGSFMYASDLMKHITIPCEISFVKLASYQGVTSTGTIKEIIGLNEDIRGREVIIVEDIVDTGRTIQTVRETLLHKGANSVKIITLLDKPSRRVVDIKADYVGFEIENEFVIGFGMDFNQRYRCLPYIGVLKDECYQCNEE